MKDWTGNTQSIQVMVGVNKQFTTEGREDNDFYATEPLATELLCEKEKFTRIWEPACGQGHISKVLIENGYEVKSTDLVDRGYGVGGVDFLTSNEKWNGDIVTNPPYRYAAEFVLHALELIPDGNKVCMFCKISFLEGVNRYTKIFKENKPKTVYVATKRLHCGRSGDFSNCGNMVTYAWFVWEKGYVGKPTIDWINVPLEDKGNLFTEGD